MLHVNNILLPRDFSDGADQAVPYALDLAGHTGARLHVLFAQVLHDMERHDEELEASEHELGERLRRSVEEHGRGHPEPDQIVHTVERDVTAAPAILRYAEEHDIDLIVMGTHGRQGAKRLALGSVAEDVVRHAPCPVFTVREQETAPAVNRIVAPIDFSEHSREALRNAKALAQHYGARIDLVHIVEETLHPAFYGPAMQSIYDAQPDIEERAVERLKTFYRETEGPDSEVTFHAGPGRAPEALAEYARERAADLIVMATHGRTGLERMRLGSVTEKLMRRAPCPVFTVKSFGKSIIGAEKQAAEEKAAP